MVVFRYASMRNQNRETFPLNYREEVLVGYLKLFNSKKKLFISREVVHIGRDCGICITGYFQEEAGQIPITKTVHSVFEQGLCFKSCFL